MDTSLPQQTPIETKISTVYKKGGFFERLLAMLIDLFLVIAVLLLLYLIFPILKSYEDFIDTLVIVLYGTLFIWLKGATLGKMALKLKVVTSSYSRVGFGHAL